MAVEGMKRNYYKGTKLLQYYAVVKSQSEPKGYSTIIAFSGVSDIGTPPNLDSTPIRVRCSCRDYYFTYEWYNKRSGALAGGPHSVYTRKTATRPERNPAHLPGMCKHLIRQIIVMRQHKLVTGGLSL
jgi:hypothetical protein